MAVTIHTFSATVRSNRTGAELSWRDFVLWSDDEGCANEADRRSRVMQSAFARFKRALPDDGLLQCIAVTETKVDRIED